MKYENTFEAKVVVEFHNPEAATRYYLEGDWLKTFNQYDDLLELSSSIAHVVMLVSDNWDRNTGFYEFIEGFGNFKAEPGSRVYKLHHEDEVDMEQFGGDITITIEDELEVYFTQEIK